MAKVLILDQSKSMRNTLRERLEYEGFSTEAAEDEEAASNMCEKIPFDVILSDTGCKIPDKGVPFIVLSSEASIDSAVEAVRNGAQDYLTKPIDMNRLLLQKQRQGNGQAEQPHCVPRGADQPGGTHRYGKIGKTEAEPVRRKAAHRGRQQCAGRRRTVADSSAKIVNRQSTAARHSARALLGLLSHHCAM